MIASFLNTPKKQLFDLHSFKKIQTLERRYKESLSRIEHSFETAFEVYLDLQRAHRSLISYIQLLRLRPSVRESKTIDPLLDAYLNDINTIHQHCTFWLKLYLGFIWPEEIISKKLRKRIRTFSKELWENQAKGSLERLTICDFIDPRRQESYETICRLYRNHESIERFSRAWNENHSRLTNAIYDELVLTSNALGKSISDKFKKTVYIFAAGTQMHEAQDITDWIDGYKQPGPQELLAETQANATFLKGLTLSEFHKNLKLTTRAFLIGFCIIAIFSLMHARQIDISIYTFLKEKTLRILSLDPASLSLKQKKDYFYKYILEINEQIKVEDLVQSLQTFKDNRIYEQPSGMYVFTEEILSKFFLLLCAGEIPEDLKADVLDTAGLMDNDVRSVIGQIAEMFDDKIVEDSKLRNLLLELRRSLVRHSIFPFTFIVVKHNTPYLFMFPEKIIKRFKFSAEQLEYIGFNSSYYSQYVRFPLRVFVVKGDRYPFKDRAGYFEGEFAIVFADLAARVEWTALHEFAHIIDQMRFTYGGRMFPKNIETNAMLLPAMFSVDPKGYFHQRLFPIIASGNAKDSYVQASKGILNGFLLWNAQRTATPSVEISDEFLPQDILTATTLIETMSDDSIREAALEIFKKPDIYLKTAKAGQYRGVISNAEEIIAGTPRAPYQGFILGSGYSSGQDGASAIKFIFDNQNDQQGFFQGKNIFGIIAEIFFFMVQAHNSDVKNFTLINAIAAVVDFILIVGFFLGIHWWGAPLRKRKFYGPDLPKWFDSVYKNNPLSHGRSSGDLPGEKQLLCQVLLSKGVVSNELHQKIKALKSGMSPQRTAVFDTLLTLAPFNPEMSMVRSKWHDFMFWFPYFGPHLARNPWLFPRQKPFRQWETFNARLLALAKNIRPHTAADTFRQDYLDILKNYKKPAPTNNFLNEKKLLLLNETREHVEELLAAPGRLDDHTTPVVARQMPWISQHDGEFDHLASYSWHDDVKRIDWKATARSPSLEAKVRKYAGVTSAHFDFLFDFRQLDQQAGRDRLARDLARSLQVLKNDNELKAVSLILPWGETRLSVLDLKSHTKRLEIFNKIWSAVTREFEEAITRQQALIAEELIFYTDGENSRYRNITRLTEFDIAAGQVQAPEHIPTKSCNIYIIGADEHNRDEIIGLLPKTHQPFYWR